MEPEEEYTLQMLEVEQDQHVDTLQLHLEHLNDVLVGIDDELASQNEILEDLTFQSDQTKDHMREGSKHIGRYLANQEISCSVTWIILCLIMVIFILFISLWYL